MDQKKREETQTELNNLVKKRSEFQDIKMDKNEARHFIIDVKQFIETVKNNYKYAEYYRLPEEDDTAKYEIENGLDKLRIYEESNRKQIDNKYFLQGKRHIIRGIEHIIWELEQKLKA